MQVAIQVNDLTKTFTSHSGKNFLQRLFAPTKHVFTAVDNISFNIPHGQIVGFIGPNGAGKTTTLKMLCGLLVPTAGTATTLGFTPHHRSHKMLHQIALVAGAKSQLIVDLPVIETLRLRKTIFEVPDAQFKKTVDTLSGLLNVGHVLHKKARGLSLGEKMKCELICSLLHKPKLLFLDEPTIGLDTTSQITLRQFIANYNREFGATIILTSHYMQDIEHLCERVIVINHGKLLYDGSLQGLTKSVQNFKHISLTTFNKANFKELEQFGELQNVTPYGATLKTTESNFKAALAHVTSTINLDDIQIKGTSLEDVIVNLYNANA